MKKGEPCSMNYALTLSQPCMLNQIYGAAPPWDKPKLTQSNYVQKV